MRGPLFGGRAYTRERASFGAWPKRADSGNRIRVPSWHTFDLGAGYATRIGNTPVRFNASVENVADKEYWIGTFTDGFLMPGAPRTFRLSATISF